MMMSKDWRNREVTDMAVADLGVEAVRRWRETADRANYEWHQWTSVSQRATPEANAAVLDLKMLLAQSIPKPVVEWAVTNWLITGRPIDVCVREELAEQRSGPSPAGKLKGKLAPPSH